MAQYKPGIALGQLKGSIGSTTFQGGNVSSVIRNKGYKKGSSSSSKSLQTSRLASITSQWKKLNAGERNAWKIAALSWSFIDKFGTPYFGTAYQCYVAYESNLALIGAAYVNTPNIVSPAVNVNPIRVLPLNAIKVVVTPTVALAVSQFYLVFATAACSQGRNTNNAKFRLIAAKDMNATVSYDFITEYKAVFGAPIAGTQIIFKFIQVNPLYPYQYFPFVVGCPVT